ncbi:MAG TPA: GNAT family N-acetyltransferase [Candidatus Limnocylindria bacterium]
MSHGSGDAPPAPPAMPRPSGPYRTARLVLRPFTADDLDAFLEMHGDPEVTRYVPYPPMTRQQAAERLERIATWTAIDDQEQNLRLAVELPESGEVIGDMSMWTMAHDRLTGEIGFVVNPSVQGRGYASEAAGELLRIGFEEAGLHRITANCDARNSPSYRVMERIGMRREAHFRQSSYEKGEWVDELVYAILADEWRTRNATE